MDTKRNLIWPLTFVIACFLCGSAQMQHVQIENLVPVTLSEETPSSESTKSLPLTPFPGAHVSVDHGFTRESFGRESIAVTQSAESHRGILLRI
ncbi:MAG: hypothetical protein AB9873_14830 [Syntrophobacteraceae bacterium]